MSERFPDAVPAASTPWRSLCCEGERCHCGQPAAAKVEEAIFPDDPAAVRHPLTAYLCARHFREAMGEAGVERVEAHRAALARAAAPRPSGAEDARADRDAAGTLAALRRLYHHLLAGGATTAADEARAGGPVTEERVSRLIRELEARDSGDARPRGGRREN